LRTRLYRLIHKLEIADEPPHDAALPAGVRLPPKDVPILLAAVYTGCSYLLAGDRRYLGRYFD
jgi:hypothetical protein